MEVAPHRTARDRARENPLDLVMDFLTARSDPDAASTCTIASRTDPKRRRPSDQPVALCRICGVPPRLTSLRDWRTDPNFGVGRAPTRTTPLQSVFSLREKDETGDAVSSCATIPEGACGPRSRDARSVLEDDRPRPIGTTISSGRSRRSPRVRRLSRGPPSCALHPVCSVVLFK